MSNVRCDAEAWKAYPHHRWIHDKLQLADRLGYDCGPAGVYVDQTNEYVIRPITNLSGMGVNARIQTIYTDDLYTVKPGEFWCEKFLGHQFTVDYEWQHGISGPTPVPMFAAQGFRTSPELYRFHAWRRMPPPNFKLPDWIVEFADVARFNVEFIGDRIIEIHLRSGVDFPGDTTQIIPIWDDMDDASLQPFIDHGFTVYSSYDDADGHLHCKRIGFLIR